MNFKFKKQNRRTPAMEAERIQKTTRNDHRCDLGVTSLLLMQRVRVAILKTLHAYRIGISWGVRKDGHNWWRWMIIKHLAVELVQEMCCPPRRVRPQTWHNWRISIGAMLCAFKNFHHRPHFTNGGYWNKSLHFQPLQRCHCENSGSPASACVAIILSRIRSRLTQ